jgi:hypothetical protein
MSITSKCYRSFDLLNIKDKSQSNSINRDIVENKTYEGSKTMFKKIFRLFFEEDLGNVREKQRNTDSRRL